MKRKENLIKHLNTIFPNVISSLINGYDYYYDERECFKMYPSELDPNRLMFKAMRINPNSPQIVSFVNYLYNYDLPLTHGNLDSVTKPMIFITKPIKMLKGGIPRYEYYHSLLGLNDRDDT